MQTIKKNHIRQGDAIILFFLTQTESKEETHKYNKTDLKVLSCMGSSALLPLLSRDNGLGGVQHQVLQLQSFHEVRVPHDT